MSKSQLWDGKDCPKCAGTLTQHNSHAVSCTDCERTFQPHSAGEHDWLENGKQQTVAENE